MFAIDNEKAQLVSQGLQIPAKPEILDQLHQEQRKDAPDLSRIADIVSADVALSANILKAINSPLFGLSRTITDIQQSVMLLGLENVMNLVSYFEMRRLIAGDACISLDRFWDTALETARIMVITLNQLKLKRDCPVEDAYALGLFHDAGVALMAMRFTDYKETLDEADHSDGENMTSIEEKHYQTNHSIIGYFVMNSWNMPKHICELILRHHEEDYLTDINIPDSQKDLYGILSITHDIQDIYHYGHEDKEWLQLKEKVLFHFGLDEDEYRDLESDIIEAYEQS